MKHTPSKRAGSLISRRAPSARTAVLAALPGHAQGLSDARHRHMMNDHARQCPAHRRTRELGTRVGCLTRVLAPHVSALRAPVAAHAHMQDRGAPAVRYMSQAPDHRVTTNALAPAASTPPILTTNTARQHCMIGLNALTRHLHPQAIQARESAQIRAIKDSIRHVEVFRMDGVGTPIIGRPRPLPGHDTPNPAHNTYTLNYEESDIPSSLTETITMGRTLKRQSRDIKAYFDHPTRTMDPPKQSTDASNTYADPHSGSKTSPTTSPEHSSNHENSDPNYTHNCKDPKNQKTTFKCLAQIIQEHARIKTENAGQNIRHNNECEPNNTSSRRKIWKSSYLRRSKPRTNDSLSTGINA